MMNRNKGQVSILVGLGLLASIVIGGIFFAGGIQNLLGFMISNFWTLFILLLGGGIVGMFLINSYQKNPRWKRDLIGFGIVIGVFVGLIFLPSATGQIYGYTVKTDVVVEKPIFGDLRINDVNIKEETFEKTGPLNLVDMPTLGYIRVGYSGKVKANCEGEQVYQADFSGSVLNVGGVNTETVTLRNLPSGKTCTVTANIVDVDHPNKILDTQTDRVTVP